MTKATRFVVLAVLVSVIAPLVAGCSSSSGNQQTVQTNKAEKQSKADK